MKNIFRLLTAAIALMAFVGCEGNEEDTTPRLTTPKLNCTISDNSIIVAWEAVSGAAYYTLQLNDGEAEKTNLTVGTFDNLMYGETYTITLVAVSADETIEDSNPAVKEVSIPNRVMPQYEQWNSIPANAISNNGRWIVGGYDKQGMYIDMQAGAMTSVTTHELYDVSDNGIAVGSYMIDNTEGEAACLNLLTGENIVVDFEDMFSEGSMSALTAITPDGTYAVGWVWDATDNYYTRLYGNIIPITYDLEKGSFDIPAIKDDMLYGHQIGGIAVQGVTPERELFGYEVSLTYFSIFWDNKNEPYDYVYFDYDEQNNPIEALGDKSNLISQSGRYVYGKGWRMEGNNQNFYPAAYDRETDTMMWMTGMGYVSAMADNGIAFINDSPYYLGTDAYVVDTNVDIMVQTPILDWLKSEHNMDLTDHIVDFPLIIGTSEDCRRMVGISNTDEGWVTFVINLDGAPM